MIHFNDSVVAALIAALASWLGLVISKESKISEFRQKWIDDLRQDLAAFIGESGRYHAYMLGLTTEYAPEKVNELSARIRLRLNFKEKKHINLFRALEEHRTYILQSRGVKDVMKRQDDAGEKEDGITLLAADVLKTEWNVVKSGEFVYRGTFLVLLSVILYSAIAYLNHRDLFWHYVQ
jgi:hypothetical protein